ncbi:MAG: DUF1501 domain-containing protein [Myxococcota bacterium]
MSVSRRDFNRLALAGLAGLAAAGSGVAVAAPSPDERKFLFVYARGGWDYSYVFAPLFDNPYCDMDPTATTAEEGGLPFVDSEGRPSVRTFMERYGNRTLFVNGYEIASVTHPRCAQILLTGKAGAIRDDFPSILAASSPVNLLMPYAVLSGPAYTASSVVRVGSDQQLPTLLNGSILQRGQTRFSLPSTESDALVDAFVQERAAAYASTAGRGRTQRYAQSHDHVLGQIQDVYGLGDPAALFDSTVPGTTQLTTAVKLLTLGLSRCVMLQDDGMYDMSWDTHAVNSDQNHHFELLFQKLLDIVAALDGATSIAGNRLSDEVVVVVLSEMGRDPRLNNSSGKHHWTWTSAMLLGPGITGGRAIGGFDEFVTGEKVDHDSGELSSTGTTLSASDLGATLLMLGGVDPAEHLPEGKPILGIITDV